MRKALVPLVAALALCGAGTAALIATNARAQISPEPRRPMMLTLAANGAAALPDAAPPAEGGMPPMPGMRRPHGAMMGRMAGEFCKNIYAHEAGGMAFLEAKLSLATAQTTAFDRWKTVKLDAARKHGEICVARVKEFSTHTGKTRPSPAARMAREEDRLKERLADLSAERPALSALYDSLNPTQKIEFDRGGMMMHHPMMAGMMGGPGMGMMHGMGPMGPHGMGPMGPPPGAPADLPPPPPPQ